MSQIYPRTPAKPTEPNEDDSAWMEFLFAVRGLSGLTGWTPEHALERLAGDVSDGHVPYAEYCSVPINKIIELPPPRGEDLVRLRHRALEALWAGEGILRVPTAPGEFAHPMVCCCAFEGVYGRYYLNDELTVRKTL